MILRSEESRRSATYRVAVRSVRGINSEALLTLTVTCQQPGTAGAVGTLFGEALSRLMKGGDFDIEELAVVDPTQHVGTGDPL